MTDLSGVYPNNVYAAWTDFDISNGTVVFSRSTNRGAYWGENYTVGYPSPAAGSPPPDADSDGLPDSFELYLTGGTSTTSATPTGDHDGDGYDNTEEWMHAFYVGLKPVLRRD